MGFKVNFDADSISSAIQQKTSDLLQNREYEITCPHCNSSVSVKPGNHPCPRCGKIIKLSLDIH